MHFIVFFYFEILDYINCFFSSLCLATCLWLEYCGALSLELSIHRISEVKHLPPVWDLLVLLE